MITFRIVMQLECICTHSLHDAHLQHIEWSDGEYFGLEAPIQSNIEDPPKTLPPLWAAFAAFNAVGRDPYTAHALTARLESMTPEAREAEVTSFMHTRLHARAWARIVGLKAKPQLNLVVCEVVGEPINGRYPVHVGHFADARGLEIPRDGARAWSAPRAGFRVRPENLRPLLGPLEAT